MNEPLNKTQGKMFEDYSNISRISGWNDKGDSDVS